MQDILKSREQNVTHVKTERQSTNPLRLLVGKQVYLDLNSYKLVNKVRECLTCIEVKIADCLSKDVEYVITNREKSVLNDSNSNNQSNNDLQLEVNKKLKTSPNALPFLSRSKSLNNNRLHSIMEKASKVNTSGDILATARRLGINVMHVSEIERYIEKYMNKKKSLGHEANEANGNEDLNNLNDNTSLNSSNLMTKKDNTPGGGAGIACDILSQSLIKKGSYASNNKIYKLKAPFLKFESICKQYKPIYQEFKIWHEINLDPELTKKTHSPFQIYFTDDNAGSSNDSSSSKNNAEIENKSNSSQTQNQKTNVFKSPTSSTLVTSTATNTTTVMTSTQISMSRPANNSSALNLNQSKQITSATTTTTTINSNRCSVIRKNSNPNKSNAANLVMNPIMKRKVNGYCECCKHKFDNLRQHLTSAQHENFERNQSNFKEIDEYINDILNFEKFLEKNELNMNDKSEQKPTEQQQHNDEVEQEKKSNSDLLELNDLRDYAREFSKTRHSLGFTQKDVVHAIQMETKDYSITESALIKFERLDISPRSGCKIKRTLDKWLQTQNEARQQIERNQRVHQSHNESQSSESSKKRKRTISINAEGFELLNDTFNKNPNPTEVEIEELAVKIKADADLVKLWFRKKHQTNQSIMKKFKTSNLAQSVALSLITANTGNSSFLEDNSLLSNTSSPHINITNNQQQTSFYKTTTKYLNNNLNVNNQNLITPIKHTSTAITSDQIHASLFKAQTPLTSSFSLSSPSAAILFGLNSNSFTVPNDIQQNTKATTTTTTTTSRFEQQQQLNDSLPHHNKENRGANQSMTNNTSISNIDDVIIDAFINDFSYEICQK